MGQVVGMQISGNGPSVAWGEIVEQLNCGTGCSPQRSNAQMRAEHIIKVLLLRSVILTFAGNPHSQLITVKPKARVSVVYDNRRVVNSQTEIVAGAMPFGQSLTFRKGENFQKVIIGITEVESFNAGGIAVPCRQRLWTAAGMLHAVLTQPGIGRIHIARNDGDVLKPAIVAARIGGHRSAFRRQKFGEFDLFLAQAKPGHADAQPENAFQVLISLSGEFFVGNGDEVQHPRIEIKRALHVRHRDPDWPYGTYERLLGLGLNSKAARNNCNHQSNTRKQPVHAGTPLPFITCSVFRAMVALLTRKRSSRWSPTRSALAMMVKAGFTALLEGKKLPSTT